MTPEQKLAERLRLQKLQEENDLKIALGTLGIVDKSGKPKRCKINLKIYIFKI
jgi:hypothetical protein